MNVVPLFLQLLHVHLVAVLLIAMVHHKKAWCTSKCMINFLPVFLPIYPFFECLPPESHKKTLETVMEESDTASLMELNAEACCKKRFMVITWFSLLHGLLVTG